jgi:hypothetical protein
MKCGPPRREDRGKPTLRSRLLGVFVDHLKIGVDDV